MKIEFSVEDNEILYDVLDGLFVTLLRKELKNSQEYLEVAKQHPDDVKMYKKNIKACKTLLKYYGGIDD